MKVKVFQITNVSGFSWYQPKPEQVENTLQEWLNNNPSAVIEHVAQTEDTGGSARVLVTIFYRD